ncbi:MAG: ATP-binding protein [Bacteroidota bacterium]
MLIPRRTSHYLTEIGKMFPVISLTGPRQAGKTTLLRDLYPGYKYVSLENPDLRRQALDDPRSFLDEYNDQVIFDEAQRWPELFSYLQGMVDEDRRPGRFILSGSQNFLLRKNITQTLAGRVGIVRLLPLDNEELYDSDLLPLDADKAIIRGFYPDLVKRGLATEPFFSSYMASYVERDVAELVNWSNLDDFQRFIRIVASYAGQNANFSKMSKDVGISLKTAQAWLGILEQSYLIFRLPAFFRNFGKRLVKTPKIYFYDTGLLCYLLEIFDPEELSVNRNKGAIFENFIIADAFKSFYHQGHSPNFYFYRDKEKKEVDLLFERGNEAQLFEIKSAKQFRPGMIKNLDQVSSYWDRPTVTSLVYKGIDEHLVGKTMLRNWRNIRWRRKSSTT